MIFDTSAVLAAKFLCGENVNICRLCLGSAGVRAVFIDDSVTLDTPFCEDIITYYHIFEVLGVSTDPYLPEKICASCSAIITNTYLFGELWTHSRKSWNEIVRQLSKIIDQTDALGPRVKEAYLLVNESNVILSNCKTKSFKNKKHVLQNINNVQSRKTAKHKRKGSKKFKCLDCSVKFSTSVMLATHNVNVHKKTASACPQCPKVFATPLQLVYHMERVHYPKKIQCLKCDKMFSTQKILNYHDKFHHTAGTCKLCFLKFPSKKLLRVHLDKHDNNKCPRCDKTLSQRITFKAHLKLCGNPEEKIPKFFCDICCKGYVRKNGIRSHLKTDHGFGYVLTCKWCGKKFDAKSKLRNHEVKHTRERNYSCEHCGNRFVTQSALVQHVRLHTGEKPFPCELCHESFISASRRMEHKRRRHFGPTKLCPKCPMKFLTKNQLQMHLQRHYNPNSKLFCLDANESQQLNYDMI